MLAFKDWLDYQEKALNEKALIFGSRSKTYPRYNNVLIMAGGSASGKSWILENIISFKGKNFDVDDIKQKLIDLPEESYLRKKFESEYNIQLNADTLRDPVECSYLHQFVKDNHMDDSFKKAFFYASISRKHKDNIIFDITLKSEDQLKEVVNACDYGNYETDKRHIVWVLTDIELAKINNQKRDRVVPEDILIKSHTGTSITMKHILERGEYWRKYIDGDVWIIFNNASIDTKSRIVGNKHQTVLIDKYTSFQLKQSGKDFKRIKDINQEIIDKINSYVPDGAEW